MKSLEQFFIRDTVTAVGLGISDPKVSGEVLEDGTKSPHSKCSGLRTNKYLII